jgi:L-ribulose-5-phosphate 4-epimerase
MIDDFTMLRRETWWANVSLPKAGLVTMHSGNASGVHRPSGLLLIKPSGVDYDALKPEDLVAIRVSDGEKVKEADVPDACQSDLRPSVDTVHHRLLYLSDDSLGGIVHTHSNYATAWAIHGRPLPCVLTAMADEFGCDVPCIPYTDNEADHIASAIMHGRGRSPAVLLACHGVFTMGTTPRSAFKTAVMLEDVARTLILAASLGPLTSMPTGEIDKWYKRYHSTYGQPQGRKI